MKRILNICSCIAIIFMCVGCLAKVMHWPGSAVMLLLSLGFLSLFYLPVYYMYKRKSMNGWKERLRTGFGIFCLSAFFLGVIFKTMHWPGAGPLFVLSMVLFSLGFVPAYMINKFRNSENGAEKAMHVFGGIVVSFITLGIAFKIMHWPGANILLMLATLLLLMGYLPCYVRASKKDSEERPEKLIRLFIIVTVIGIWITMSLDNTSNSIINTFCLIDERMDQSNKNLNRVNEIVNSTLSLPGNFPDSTVQKIKKVHLLRVELYNYIQRIKTELYVNLQVPREEADSLKLADLGPKNNFDIPTYLLLGNDPERPREGDLSARELKNKIAVYRMDLLSLVNDDSDSELRKVIGLSTEDLYDRESESETPWESYYFWHVPAVTVITTLSQFQSEVLNSESAVLTYINKKSNRVSGAAAEN
jgi:hypothetical protein